MRRQSPRRAGGERVVRWTAYVLHGWRLRQVSLTVVVALVHVSSTTGKEMMRNPILFPETSYVSVRNRIDENNESYLISFSFFFSFFFFIFSFFSPHPQPVVTCIWPRLVLSKPCRCMQASSCAASRARARRMQEAVLMQDTTGLAQTCDDEAWGLWKKKKNEKKRYEWCKDECGNRNTHYQIWRSANMLVKLLRQLLRDHRAHCFRNLGLFSRVVLTSTSGWYWI